LTQTFVESCVDFEVANLSILLVQRLPHLEIPTLILRLVLKHMWSASYTDRVYA